MLHEMPPGMSGVMMAGLFAAGLGSLNSAINAMSATFLNDFYRPMRPGRSEEHYLRAGRLGVVGWGLILGGFACICVYWYESSSKTGATLIDFALGVMTFAYAGLVAVFLCAILTKRGNSVSACAALATGFLIVLAMQPVIYRQWAGLITWTTREPRSPEEWSNGPVHSLADFTIAYPWHLTIGAVIAFLVCVLGTPRPRSPRPIA
jgi:Na+/proline symporter